MKAGWAVKTLGEVCTKIQDGAHESPQKTFPEAGPGRFPYLTSKNIRNGYLDLSDLGFVDDAFHQSIYPRCNPELGDVLLTKDGSNTGNVSLNTLDGPFSTLSSVCLLKPDRQVLSPSFLTYYLRSADGFAQITGQMTGAAIKRIILKTIKTSTIPLPPLDEQERIVEVLDAAFEGLARARDHTEANLQNARELVEGITRAAFDGGGDIVTLEEVADIPSALVDPRELPFADLPHVGAGNMETGSDKLMNVLTAREERLISGKYTFDTSMVLYSKIRPYLRKAARPDFVGLCSADVYPIRPNPNRLDRNYLFHLLLGPNFTDYAISGSNRVGMPKVNRDHLFAYAFPLPSLKLQREVSAKIDEVMGYCEESASNYRAKLTDLDDLRQSLLQKAFAGELT